MHLDWKDSTRQVSTSAELELTPDDKSGFSNASCSKSLKRCKRTNLVQILCVFLFLFHIIKIIKSYQKQLHTSLKGYTIDSKADGFQPTSLIE